MDIETQKPSWLRPELCSPSQWATGFVAVSVEERWSSPRSQPLEVMRVLSLDIEVRTACKPDLILMATDVAEALRRHPDITSRADYLSGHFSLTSLLGSILDARVFIDDTVLVRRHGRPLIASLDYAMGGCLLLTHHEAGLVLPNGQPVVRHRDLGAVGVVL